MFVRILATVGIFFLWPFLGQLLATVGVHSVLLQVIILLIGLVLVWKGGK
jgi:hypothetical protein